MSKALLRHVLSHKNFPYNSWIGGCGYRMIRPTTSSSYPELDTSFNNAKEAYRSKTTWEIIRAYVVFRLLTINYLADNQMQVMKISRKLMGRRPFEWLMKGTFFGHFVAGENENDIAPAIQRMRKFGVNAILDYSAEEDVQEEPTIIDASKTPVLKDKKKVCLKKFEGDICTAKRREKAVVRTYFYQSEAACDQNLKIFLNSVKAVAGTTEAKGFAAIKATAIAKPQLLMRVSEAIERVHVFIGYFTGVFDNVNNQDVKIEELKHRFERAAKEDPKVQKWLDDIEDKDSTGIINLLPWKSLLLAKKSVRDAMRIPNIRTGKLEDIIECPFSEEETLAFNNALRRFHTVFTAARDANVRVMVDAEQTYLQPAISRVTIEMMRIYNVERPIVFNTYQCYLKSAYHNLTTDLNQSERQGFHFGAKLVRGAYMDQERQRAKELGYDDPINDNYEGTTEMYAKCMGECLRRMKEYKAKGQLKRMSIMAATHNEDTVRFVIKGMKEHGLTREDRCISFGQLYGMCDQISFPLGQSGYSAYKYVPYGPIAEVLPYLSRRAQENKGFLGKTDKERGLLWEELQRRFKSGEIGHNPDK